MYVGRFSLYIYMRDIRLLLLAAAKPNAIVFPQRSLSSAGVPAESEGGSLVQAAGTEPPGRLFLYFALGREASIRVQHETTSWLVNIA